MQKYASGPETSLSTHVLVIMYTAHNLFPVITVEQTPGWGEGNQNFLA